MRHSLRMLLVVLSLSFLSGCGSGGSESSDTTNNSTQPSDEDLAPDNVIQPPAIVPYADIEIKIFLPDSIQILDTQVTALDQMSSISAANVQELAGTTLLATATLSVGSISQLSGVLPADYQGVVHLNLLSHLEYVLASKLVTEGSINTWKEATNKARKLIRDTFKLLLPNTNFGLIGSSQIEDNKISEFYTLLASLNSAILSLGLSQNDIEQIFLEQLNKTDPEYIPSLLPEVLEHIENIDVSTLNDSYSISWSPVSHDLEDRYGYLTRVTPVGNNVYSFDTVIPAEGSLPLFSSGIQASVDVDFGDKEAPAIKGYSIKTTDGDLIQTKVKEFGATYNSQFGSIEVDIDSGVISVSIPMDGEPALEKTIPIDRSALSSSAVKGVVVAKNISSKESSKFSASSIVLDPTSNGNTLAVDIKIDKCNSPATERLPISVYYRNKSTNKLGYLPAFPDIETPGLYKALLPVVDPGSILEDVAQECKQFEDLIAASQLVFDTDKLLNSESMLARTIGSVCVLDGASDLFNRTDSKAEAKVETFCKVFRYIETGIEAAQNKASAGGLAGSIFSVANDFAEVFGGESFCTDTFPALVSLGIDGRASYEIWAWIENKNTEKETITALNSTGKKIFLEHTLTSNLTLKISEVTNPELGQPYVISGESQCIGDDFDEFRLSVDAFDQNNEKIEDTYIDIPKSEMDFFENGFFRLNRPAKSFSTGTLSSSAENEIITIFPMIDGSPYPEVGAANSERVLTPPVVENLEFSSSDSGYFTGQLNPSGGARDITIISSENITINEEFSISSDGVVSFDIALDEDVNHATLDYTLSNNAGTTGPIGAIFNRPKYEAIAYYSFNGNANDDSGNGNNGVESGDISYVSGLKGLAASFDGLSNIQVQHPIGLNNDFSMSFWMKTNTTKAAAGLITEHGSCTSETSNFYTIIYGPAGHDLYSGQMQFQVKNSSRMDTPSSQVIDNQWHHIATVTDDGTMRMYIDGNLAVNDEIFSDLSDFNDVTLSIGGFYADMCSENHNYEGLLDEVRIYNRALSANEVQSLSAE